MCHIFRLSPNCRGAEPGPYVADRIGLQTFIGRRKVMTSGSIDVIDILRSIHGRNHEGESSQTWKLKASVYGIH